MDNNKYLEVLSELQSWMRRESKFTQLHHKLRIRSYPFRSLLNYLPTTGNIADIGCGYGTLTFLLARLYPDIFVYAFDPSMRKADVARRLLGKLSNIYFSSYKKEFLGLPQLLDAVVIVDVLYLLSSKERKDLIKNMANLLKKGGRIYVGFVPRQFHFRYFLAFVQEWFMVRIFHLTHSSGTILSFQSVQELKDLFKVCGIRFLSLHYLPTSFPFYHQHYLAIGEKS